MPHKIHHTNKSWRGSAIWLLFFLFEMQQGLKPSCVELSSSGNVPRVSYCKRFEVPAVIIQDYLMLSAGKIDRWKNCSASQLSKKSSMWGNGRIHKYSFVGLPPIDTHPNYPWFLLIDNYWRYPGRCINFLKNAYLQESFSSSETACLTESGNHHNFCCAGAV